ncbi:mechanosensitive ion channel family protein [bacterium]|nr:mechanosensitive ion channel family protein [bacterium]
MIELIPPVVESHWIEFLIWTAVILSVLWVLRKLELFGKFKPGRVRMLRRLIPMVDAIGAVLIVLLLGSILFKDQPTYRIGFTVAVFVFILWLLRISLLDVVSGIILRFEHLFSPGDQIDFGEGSGTIVKVGLRCLDITVDKGKQISIPYSRLSSESLVKLSSSQLVKSAVFNLEIPKSASNIAEIISQLKREIMTQPWSIAALKPTIDLLDEELKRSKFKITVYALELEHLVEIERALREKYPTPG